MNNLFNTTYYLFSIVMAVIIIVLAYFTTYFIAKRSNNMINNRHAKIIEKTALGLNLNVIVLQINNKVYILLQHYKDIELLDVVNEQDWVNESGLSNYSLNEQTIERVKQIKNMFIPKRKDIKGENDKDRNE